MESPGIYNSAESLIYTIVDQLCKPIRNHRGSSYFTLEDVLINISNICAINPKATTSGLQLVDLEFPYGEQYNIVFDLLNNQEKIIDVLNMLADSGQIIRLDSKDLPWEEPGSHLYTIDKNSQPQREL
ncbi:hypothetical protein KC678_01905 [Candidatus Dojkabacteria bacterium]|uniref:Uncharacterized protein n=1 Tax=Candidatus Dojkabacteria bacterium TaxID=2099670 RepID=A0A955ICI0_9BACT|nr:hypothetical protein [Candidatus Dojkabacteria bacterium]